MSIMPSFLYVLRSAAESMTEQCAWEPFSRPRCSSARCARESVLAEVARAMSTSSLCRRGLEEPRCWTFSRWMGSSAGWEIRWMLWSMPDRCYSALSSAAAEQPMSGVVLPVMIVPSGS